MATDCKLTDIFLVLLTTLLLPFTAHCDSKKSSSMWTMPEIIDTHHQWVAELGSGSESILLAKRIANELGLRYLGQHGAFDDVHIFEGKPPQVKRNSSHSISRRSANLEGRRWLSLVEDRLQSFSKVGFAERQVPLKRVKRTVSSIGSIDYPLNDPLYAKSWYLNGDVDNGNGMNIIAAWQAGYSGAGVVVTILDDGIERNHPDLKANYDALASYDFNSRDSDPTPRYDAKNTNQHGTRCAGQVAAVANNSICSVGVAFNARIGGVRMLDGKVTDSLEADALSLRLDHIDIFSASWGPPDDGETVDGPGHLARRALLRGVVKGRDGRGSIFVWSSGNGGLFEDSCACDGYANSIYTLSISSASERGMKPWYLEECASTIAATYSSGEPMFDRQVVTTDLRGGCTDNHTGTSASAPIAAGIVALALEANPRLTWRDVQHIVVETARPEPLLQDGVFLVNGAGKKVSSRFGFGLMDALGMVRMAEQWKTVPDQHICTASVNDWVTHTIPPEEPLTLNVETSACSGTDDSVQYLEHVEARISLWYSVRGDLEIYLTSPSGTRSQLLPPRSYDDREGEFRDWPFISVQFWGEQGAGNWTLEILNVGPEENSGGLRRWSLILHGTDTAPTSTLQRRSPQSPPTSSPFSTTDSMETTEETSTQELPTPTPEPTFDFEAPTFDELIVTPILDLTHLCPSNCSNCTDSYRCIKCDPGLYLMENISQCQTECPPGFCANDEKMTCGDCFLDELVPVDYEAPVSTTGPATGQQSEVTDLMSFVFGDVIGRRLPAFVEGAVDAAYRNSAHEQCHRCNFLAVTLVIGVAAFLTLSPSSDAGSLISLLFCT